MCSASRLKHIKQGGFSRHFLPCGGDKLDCGWRSFTQRGSLRDPVEHASLPNFVGREAAEERDPCCVRELAYRG